MAMPTPDLTNRTFGLLIAKYRAPSKKEARWKCKCQCGKVLDCASQDLVHGRRQSCGCLKKPARKNIPVYRYAVEKDIPIPPPRRGNKGTTQSGGAIYPFNALDIGDSFFVPYEDTGVQGWSRINQAINIRQQKSDVRYCWRFMENNDGTKGYRVWRMK
jgi:hypothetical protein